MRSHLVAGFAVVCGAALGAAGERGPAHHPLVESRASVTGRSERSGPRGHLRCLRLSLQIKDIVEGGSLTGALRVQNACAAAVAILLEPVETIVRTPSDRWEISLDPDECPCAHLFLTHMGWNGGKLPHVDGGAPVKGEPAYATVDAGRTVEIPLAGQSAAVRQLVSGSYEASFLTHAARDPGTNATVTEINLERSVANHNEASGDAQPAHLRREAESVSAGSTFRVLPKRP